ncbi:MAG TPA: superoxide dismutase, partial [Chlamydiales bacterium]|nr:superoxide dismutase [Chlamydiales bacterium]
MKETQLMHRFITAACIFATTLFSSLLLAADTIEKVNAQVAPFELLPLPYTYDALEPSIDTRTMHLHHDKHHRAYVDNLNTAILQSPFKNKTLPELFAVNDTLPDAIRNNAGGHWNHSFYWEMMTPIREKQAMSERLKKRLIDAFGSIEKFKEEFRNAGLKRFGSGYAWLIETPTGELKICSTPNQDNPLMNNAPMKGRPLLVGDVWEHAYYLNYQNRRGDYLDAFWNVVNWN